MRLPRRLIWDNEPGIGRGKRHAEGVVCVSGWSSLASCGLDVVGLSAELCDVDGCTPGLFQYNPAGGACAGGYSGAPVYQRPGNGHAARIMGSHVGEDENGCMAEKVRNVEDHLDVTVATSP